MKKNLICIVMTCLMITSQAFAYNHLQNNTNSPITPGGVLCNANRTACTVGYHTMRSSKSKPLYVNDGILCNYKRTKCTNGFTFMRSSKPLY